MSLSRYRVVFTDAARAALRDLDGAERLANIAPGALSREGLRALLADTALGTFLEDLESLAGDPYGGPTLARTAGAEDDRTGLLGALAVTYMVSPVTEPPVITVTRIRPPKG
ncbi:hypothetical protein [Actinacidiphila sp. ITFR-21]|uniref:hypothetical protein n=1 Tax=Actinacidiphila sp. ITFR-21 TaxID=3075199 RepID=UPI0028897992|nr:hypothetical protein [Streptomyces sp. ITFR-21]WNI19946.1 hypothetical protein RLT57_30865 [Streptomyces sp. ITFR-21]